MVTRKATTVAAAAVETVANQFTSRAAACSSSRTHAPVINLACHHQHHCLRATTRVNLLRFAAPTTHFSREKASRLFLVPPLRLFVACHVEARRREHTWKKAILGEVATTPVRALISRFALFFAPLEAQLVAAREVVSNTCCRCAAPGRVGVTSSTLLLGAAATTRRTRAARPATSPASPRQYAMEGRLQAVGVRPGKLRRRFEFLQGLLGQAHTILWRRAVCYNHIAKLAENEEENTSSRRQDYARL